MNLEQQPPVKIPGTWRGLLATWDELKVCRFALIVAIVGAFIFWQEDQGVEVLRALGEETTGLTVPLIALRFAAALAGALTWALASWYSARVLLYFDFPDLHRAGAGPGMIRDRMRPFLVIWLPRVLGIAPFLILAIGFARAAKTYDSGAVPPKYLMGYAGLCAIIAVALLIFFIRRCETEPADRGRRSAIMELELETRVALAVMLGISLALLVLFTWNPIFIGIRIGTAGVLLFAAASWVVFGSIAIYVASWFRFPVIGAALVWIAIASLWNDNHIVRTAPRLEIQRPRLEHAFHNWHKLVAKDGAQSHPLFIVATEGGGIRAAYWTATVLGTLEEKSRAEGLDFAGHLFAISGVSGGSVGAAAFNAELCADGQNTWRQGRRVSEANAANPPPVSAPMQSMLGTDFLAPIVAALLYPDFLQRYLPVAIPALDRGQWLEKSWERAGKEYLQDDCFAANFDTMWKKADAAGVWMPALFLNGTTVEGGRRIIASNIVVDGHFPDAIDVATMTANRLPDTPGGCEIPLSTAAHGSARFTYVSPAGRFPDGSHIVDGGYFENSGSTTATEILRGIERIIEQEKITDVVPYIITISNDPASSPHGGHQMDVAAGHPSMMMEMRKQQPSSFLEDFIAPLKTLFATRDAHNSYAQIAMQEAQHFEHIYYFGLSPSQVPLPLGWMLSGTATREMDRQMEVSYEKVDGKNNPARVQEILALLKAASAPGTAAK